MKLWELIRAFFMPGQALTREGGEMSDRLKQALGANEEVKFFQLVRLGQLTVITVVCRALGVLFLCSIFSGGAGALISLICAAFFFAIPYLLPEYEYVITETRVMIGERAFGQFKFNIVSIDMVSGVKIGSSTFPYSLFGSSVLEIQHTGGPTHLPVMGGKDGEDTALTVVRLLEEGRSDSAQRRAQSATPLPGTPLPTTSNVPAGTVVRTAPPAPAHMDKKTQLDLLRHRLLDGTINQETYNNLREEIEND